MYLLYKAFTLPYPNIFAYLTISLTVVFCILGILGALLAYAYPVMETEAKEVVEKLFNTSILKNKIVAFIDKVYDAIIVALFLYFGCI